MNRIASALLLFLAIFMILLGAIFVIASGTENILAGGVFLAIAALLLFFVYRYERIEASKPKLINQTFNVKMGGSGELKQRELKCRSCGAALEDKDLRVVDGGVVVKCPYCGTIYAFEEEPKW
ncbi:hypothetical protein [Methanomassiliicoccus luminyensis]|uniref:hypothetical protein n=1 Tax=Methanomassiliicoccus luminyensis TaxID=1080712 RepID=UPI000382506B|nr:hypothetical protein [Methanomassiliicoccus luminyensis]